jgi:hypothetical protein
MKTPFATGFSERPRSPADDKGRHCNTAVSAQVCQNELMGGNSISGDFNPAAA